MRRQLDARLIGPLMKIAQLALARASYREEYDPDLDLFDLRKVMYPELVVAFLRQQIETLSNGSQTIREVDSRAIVTLFGHNLSYCALCDATTPEGIVTQAGQNMFAFAVCGAVSGYIPLEFRN